MAGPLRRLASQLRAGPVGDAARLRRARWRPGRNRLFDLELDAEVADVRRQVEIARMRKHRHDLVNAFAAVDLAAMILARDTLSERDRSTLAELMESGLSRLRALVVADPEDHVALAELSSLLSDDPCWPDPGRVDVADGLVVVGSPGEIAETVRQVLAYACGRPPSGPVSVRASRNGNRIELWVDDHGPQFTARERVQLLQPERRRSLGPVAVGGLDVAMRLLRGQGGDMKVEARAGGGESFGISWPGPVD